MLKGLKKEFVDAKNLKKLMFETISGKVVEKEKLPRDAQSVVEVTTLIAASTHACLRVPNLWEPLEDMVEKGRANPKRLKDPEG
jgi:hypothetical protein